MPGPLTLESLQQVKEAVQCVQDLEAPHFLHEVVKRVVFRAVERGEAAMRMAVYLASRLSWARAPFRAKVDRFVPQIQPGNLQNTLQTQGGEAGGVPPPMTLQ